MKSLAIKILSLIMALLIIMPFVFACGKDEETKKEEQKETQPEKPFSEMSEAEKAFYIFNLKDIDAENVKLEMSMYISTLYRDIPVVINLSTLDYETGIDTSSYSHYSITVTETDMSYLGSSVTTEIEGYVDGKMFIYSDDGSEKAGYWSYTNVNDYLDYQNEASDSSGLNNMSDLGLTKDSCETISCVQDEDGNWVATVTDVNEEGLEKFKTLLGDFEGMVNPSSLVDVILVETVTSDFKPVSLSLQFVFSSQTPPTFSIRAEFTLGDSVVAPKVDLNEYTEVDDLLS